MELKLINISIRRPNPISNQQHHSEEYRWHVLVGGKHQGLADER